MVVRETLPLPPRKFDSNFLDGKQEVSSTKHASDSRVTKTRNCYRSNLPEMEAQTRWDNVSATVLSRAWRWTMSYRNAESSTCPRWIFSFLNILLSWFPNIERYRPLVCYQLEVIGNQEMAPRFRRLNDGLSFPFYSRVMILD